MLLHIRHDIRSLPLPFILYLLFGGLLPLFALLPIRIFGAAIGTHLLLILLLFSYIKFSYKREFFETKSTLFIPLLALYSVIIFQLLIHPSDIRQLFYYIIILLLYFIAMRIASSPDKSTVEQLIKWLKYGALISFFFGVVQYSFDWQLYTAEMQNDVLAAQEQGYIHRASGGMLSPNGYGYFAALMAALSFSELYHLRNRVFSNRKFAHIFLFFAFSVSQVFASQSRSALLGLLVAILVVFLKGQQNKTVLLKQIVGVFMLLAAIVLIYFSLFESVDTFLLRTGDDPRWMLWGNGFEYLISSPETLLIGLGIGDSNRAIITFSDNLFIELLLTGGLPLLIAFCWFLFSPVCKKNDYLKLKLQYPQYLTMVMMWRVIFFIAAMFSSAIGFLPFTPIYFFVFFFASRLAISVHNKS